MLRLRSAWQLGHTQRSHSATFKPCLLGHTEQSRSALHNREVAKITYNYLNIFVFANSFINNIQTKEGEHSIYNKKLKTKSISIEPLLRI